MKEATGELNMTVITIVAIAAIGAILWSLWPSIQNSIESAWGAACRSDADCANGRTCIGTVIDENGRVTTPGTCEK